MQILAAFAVVFLYISFYSLLVLWFYLWVKKRKLGEGNLLMLLLWVGIFLMFLYLQISMPYGCSMDFRYIVPILLPFGAFLAYSGNEVSSLPKKNFGKALYRVMSTSVIVLLVLTSVFYLAAI